MHTNIKNHELRTELLETSYAIVGKRYSPAVTSEEITIILQDRESK